MKLVVFVCVFSHSCGVTGFMCTYVCARVRVCGMFDKPVMCTYVWTREPVITSLLGYLEYLFQDLFGDVELLWYNDILKCT
jgi:hypothetical protein